MGYQQGSEDRQETPCLWLVDSCWPGAGHNIPKTLWQSNHYFHTHFPISWRRHASGKGLFAETSHCKQNSFCWSTSVCAGLQGWAEVLFLCFPFSPKVKAAEETNTVWRQRGHFFTWSQPQLTALRVSRPQCWEGSSDGAWYTPGAVEWSWGSEETKAVLFWRQCTEERELLRERLPDIYRLSPLGSNSVLISSCVQGKYPRPGREPIKRIWR